MKKQFFALFLCLLLLDTSVSLSFAAPIINEFSAGGSADWIEIYNSGSETIDLSKYRFRDQTANNKLDLSGSLASYGFATFDWSNKLNNGGDLIKLVLSSDESIIDQISYGEQGGLSITDTSQTVGRKSDASSEWVIFTSSSKNSSNNSSAAFSPPTPTPSKTPTPTKTSTTAKASSADVKTPTPKISLVINTASAKTTNPNTASTKVANSAKISTYSKSASQFASIKSITKDENEKEVKVLGTKDTDYSKFTFLIGGVFLLLAAGMFSRKILKEKGIL